MAELLQGVGVVGVGVGAAAAAATAVDRDGFVRFGDGPVGARGVEGGKSALVVVVVKGAADGGGGAENDGEEMPGGRPKAELRASAPSQLRSCAKIGGGMMALGEKTQSLK